MTKSILTVDVNVVGIEKIRSLIDALYKHKDDLPLEVVELLRNAIDCKE